MRKIVLLVTIVLFSLSCFAEQTKREMTIFEFLKVVEAKYDKIENSVQKIKLENEIYLNDNTVGVSSGVGYDSYDNNSNEKISYGWNTTLTGNSSFGTRLQVNTSGRTTEYEDNSYYTDSYGSSFSVEFSQSIIQGIVDRFNKVEKAKIQYDEDITNYEREKSYVITTAAREFIYYNQLERVKNIYKNDIEELNNKLQEVSSMIDSAEKKLAISSIYYKINSLKDSIEIIDNNILNKKYVLYALVGANINKENISFVDFIDIIEIDNSKTYINNLGKNFTTKLKYNSIDLLNNSIQSSINDGLPDLKFQTGFEFDNAYKSSSEIYKYGKPNYGIGLSLTYTIFSTNNEKIELKKLNLKTEEENLDDLITFDENNRQKYNESLEMKVKNNADVLTKKSIYTENEELRFGLIKKLLAKPNSELDLLDDQIEKFMYEFDMKSDYSFKYLDNKVSMISSLLSMLNAYGKTSEYILNSNNE
ncbi:MAG: hypothetical protein JXR48_02095 [Candidatus Delongbacteria bacterium]|nr:hypothetical protein [Candidatus Delongbacteria bacterium]MBN2833737.1 hypothetical protein [Candidatus Delongbacteria bacterium]